MPLKIVLDLQDAYYRALAQLFKGNPKIVRSAHLGIKRVEQKRNFKRLMSDNKHAISRSVKRLCGEGSLHTHNEFVAEWFRSKGYNVTKQDSGNYRVSVELSDKELSDIMMKN